MVAHTYNPSTGKDPGGWLIQGQLGLYKETPMFLKKVGNGSCLAIATLFKINTV
jgi:hypothetical protein